MSDSLGMQKAQQRGCRSPGSSAPPQRSPQHLHFCLPAGSSPWPLLCIPSSTHLGSSVDSAAEGCKRSKRSPIFWPTFRSAWSTLFVPSPASFCEGFFFFLESLTSEAFSFFPTPSLSNIFVIRWEILVCFELVVSRPQACFLFVFFCFCLWF